MQSRSFLTLSVLLFAGIFSFSQTTQNAAQAPTLADVARQNRKAKAHKVITSEDMKAAEEPAAQVEPAAEASAKAASKPRSPEALIAAQEKLEVLKDREGLTTRNIARFEASIADADKEGNENHKRMFRESLEQAQAALPDITKQREAAEKEIAALKEADAAAAAAATAKKKPAKTTAKLKK